MHSGIKFTKMPTVKKHSNGLVPAKMEIETGDSNDTGGFQQLLADYIGRHPKYLTQSQMKFETLRAEINSERMGFSSIRNASLLNTRTSKVSEGLPHKHSPGTVITDEIELVSNIVKKAHAISKNPMSRLNAPKTLRPAGGSVNMQLTPVNQSEVKLKINAPTSRIPLLNASKHFVTNTPGRPPATDYRGLHSSLYNKLKARQVTLAAPKRPSPKREPLKPSPKSSTQMPLRPYDKYKVEKEIMERRIAELEGSTIDLTDTTKAWILNNNKDKRIHASKILGHIIPHQNTVASRTAAPAHDQPHQMIQEAIKKLEAIRKLEEPLKIVETSGSTPSATAMTTMVMRKQGITPPQSLTNMDAAVTIEPVSTTIVQAEITELPVPRLETVKEKQRRPDTVEEYLNQPDESDSSMDEPELANASDPANPVFHSNLEPALPLSSAFHPIMEPVDQLQTVSSFDKLTDFDIYERKVDMEVEKYPRSSTGKDKHAPVFFITKQGTLVRGAPLTAPKKPSSKPSQGFPLRKWTEDPTVKRYPAKAARLRNNQHAAHSKSKTFEKWDEYQIDVEQGDRFAEVKAKLTSSIHNMPKAQADVDQNNIEPPTSEKFHEVLRRIRTLEGQFEDMHGAMSVLQQEKKIFESYLKQMNGGSGPKAGKSKNVLLSAIPAKVRASTPSYRVSSLGSRSRTPSENDEGSPESNRSFGDMSVSSTGDEAMTREFLQTYDSILSISNDSPDPTLWHADDVSSTRNVGAYIEAVYERAKSSQIKKILEQELLIDELFSDEDDEGDEYENTVVIGHEKTETMALHWDMKTSSLTALFLNDIPDSTQYQPVLQGEPQTSGSEARDSNESSLSTGNEDETHSEDTSPLTPDAGALNAGFRSWKPEGELDSDFLDRSEDYYGESDESEPIPNQVPALVLPLQVATEVESLYENQAFDYLYETQAPVPGSLEQLERKASRNELGSSIQLSLVNSQAFPFTTLERFVLGHLEQLPDSPEASAATGFLSPRSCFRCQSSVSQLSVVSLPVNLPLIGHTQSFQFISPTML